MTIALLIFAVAAWIIFAATGQDPPGIVDVIVGAVLGWAFGEGYRVAKDVNRGFQD